VSEVVESHKPEVRKDLVGPKRRGRNLALLAALGAFVLIVYVVTIVKFEYAMSG